MRQPKVLISILNWNAAESTCKTVNSVLLSEYTNFAILIIDNHSADDSLKTLKTAFPLLEIIKASKNLGYAGGHKISAKRTLEKNFDLLWILNNDVEVYPFTLSKFIEAYNRNGDSLLGSVSLQEDGKTILIGGGSELVNKEVDLSIPYNQHGGKNYFETVMEERPVSDLEGASFIIPVNVIKQYGFMDTRFFLYGEESDYCYRLRNRYNVSSIIVPSATVIHLASKSFRLSPRLPLIKAYYLTRNSHLLHYRYFRNNRLEGNGGILHFLRFFFNHYFIVRSKDKDSEYWMRYYTKLGAFHGLLRFKGKYLEPNNFLNADFAQIKKAGTVKDVDSSAKGFNES